MLSYVPTISAALVILAGASDDMGGAEDTVMLLQRAQKLEVAENRKESHALHPPDAGQATRLQAALPLQWQHIPKCGSSIGNFLIHLPGVCPGIPDDLVISEDTFGERQLRTFTDQWRVSAVDGPCLGRIGKFGADITGIGSDWETRYKGHAVTMLRQPEQRVLSGYHYGYHSWPHRLGKPANELEYAKVTRGCMVSMLTRESPEESCVYDFDETPTEQEMHEAIHRLRTGFVFVGLTDQWALSMCLGHRILGGSCRYSDFLDNRVSQRNTTSLHAEKPTVRAWAPPYDVTVLQGFRDPLDGPLYEVAQEVFQRDSEHYGVSLESCKPCFEEAGINVKE